MRWAFGMLWLGSLVAQDPSVADLRAADWRVRNAAAAGLATAPTIDVAALVEVLRFPWDGKLPELGRYGGRGVEPILRRSRGRMTSLDQLNPDFRDMVQARCDEGARAKDLIDVAELEKARNQKRRRSEQPPASPHHPAPVHPRLPLATVPARPT